MAELRRDDDLVAAAAQRLAQQRLAEPVLAAVDVGRVDEGDAGVERRGDDRVVPSCVSVAVPGRPKLLQPRPTAETRRPDRPSERYSRSVIRPAYARRSTGRRVVIRRTRPPQPPQAGARSRCPIPASRCRMPRLRSKHDQRVPHPPSTARSGASSSSATATPSTALSIERDGALPHDGEPERSNDVLDAARRAAPRVLRRRPHRLRPAGAPRRHGVPAGRLGRARARSAGARPSRTASSAAAVGKPRVGPRGRRRRRREPGADHRAVPPRARAPTAASPATAAATASPPSSGCSATRASASRRERRASAELVVGDDGRTRCAWGGERPRVPPLSRRGVGHPAARRPVRSSRRSASRDSRPGCPGSRSCGADRRSARCSTGSTSSRSPR